MKNEKINIVKIGKIAGKCYEFEDVWTGYDPNLDKIDVICAIHTKSDENIFDLLKTKVSVNIAREFGTQFVEKFCNISIINYL